MDPVGGQRRWVEETPHSCTYKGQEQKTRLPIKCVIKSVAIVWG